MAVFAYRASDSEGRIIRGVVEGRTEADALRALEKQALTVLTLKQARSKKQAAADQGLRSRIALPMAQVLEFTRQLRVMLEAGVPLLTALAVLAKRARGDYRRLLERIATDIQSGTTLSEALSHHPRTFDAFYIGSVRAGEAAGVHTDVLTELTKYYEQRAAIRRELRSALMYPTIVVLALVVACIVLLTWVVPQFAGMFASLGTDLPLPTRVLLAISAFVRHQWPILLTALALAAAVAHKLLSLPAVRMRLGALLTRVPLIGPVIFLATVVQFCRMMALLERAGLPLLESLKVIEDLLMPGPIRRLVGHIRQRVAGGATIASAVAEMPVLPDMAEHMIHVGESAGKLDETLTAAADFFEEQMRLRLKALLTLLEPALTLVVSLLVLGVAMAIFMPMWDMNTALLHPGVS